VIIRALRWLLSRIEEAQRSSAAWTEERARKERVKRKLKRMMDEIKRGTF